jgi:hypothetical protein
LSASAAQTPPAKGNDPFDLPNRKKEDRELADLAKQLKAPDPKARLKAIEAIAAKGEAAAAVAGPLCDAVMDASPRVGTAALQAVEKVRPDLYKPLTAFVVDQDYNRRLAATKELGLMGDKAMPAVNLLTAGLRRELAKGAGGGLTEMQQALFTSIRQIKPDDTATVAIYKAIASPTNRHSAARSQALDFLHEWAGDDQKRRREVLPLLKAGLSDATCQLGCIRHLGEYGSLAKECLPQLKQLNLSADAAVREAATASVDKIENQ